MLNGSLRLPAMIRIRLLQMNWREKVILTTPAHLKLHGAYRPWKTGSLLMLMELEKYCPTQSLHIGLLLQVALVSAMGIIMKGVKGVCLINIEILILFISAVLAGKSHYSVQKA
ncbi:MAG: hypothetical protein EB078_05095 [Proteobacteria bacterium]|nr:hypothetical protein [Pseudomonadota bacterium]NDC25250.1 hypothetical protein [Pseudomonadota bacterium]NDD04261.1 hypothetical protein [Pseudomonadota bacterium]NDG26783.1 hypothetical protein [Pseudomonadota bacterium]